jgi:hypothetical protein
MPSRHIRNNGTRRDCLGNNPSLLIIDPSPAADHARDFRMAPSELRVVTNVVHNVHTIPIRENHDRALLEFFQLRGVKAPLTLLKRSVHPFNLAVRPRMIWFRQPVLDAVPMTQLVEHMGAPMRCWSETILR